MSVLVVSFIYVLIGGLGVGIFLWGKPDGNSLFDRAYRLICQHTPRAIKRVLRKVLGQRAVTFLDNTWEYLCYTVNPAVQLFYLCVVCGGFSTFVVYGYPHIPNRYVAGFHRYAGVAVYMICLSVWWLACRSDPGTVTAANVSKLVDHYPYDEVIFHEGVCSTCEVVKPARSKHCGLCGICVARFDHHCIWINNCVGIGNHKWFLAFLFWHMVLCTYGTVAGVIIVYQIIQEKELFKAVFVDPVTKERHQATYPIVLQYMLAKEGMVIFVTVLCTVMGLVLVGFLGWHLNLVRTATTTNEMSKWGYVRWELRQQGPEGKKHAKELQNSYNKGFVSNFKEVLFPIDVHRLGVQADQRIGKGKNKDKPKKS